MNINKKLVIAGVTVAAVGAMTAAPAVNAASLTTKQPTLPQLSAKDKIVRLSAQHNAAVDVETDLNCMNHTLVARVTNRTKGDITPNVTFNAEDPSFPQEGMVIKPGKTSAYYWSFSGNNVLTDVKVQVDTFDDLILSPTLNCTEPVSFQVTTTSESMVSGMLTNNSGFVAQTVYTRVNGGDVRVENLRPGETRQIALPFHASFPSPQSAFVAIGTDAGYEGTYSVSLDRQIIRPLPVK